MKRDLNLVREILLWGIAQEKAAIHKNPEFPEYSKELISYHILIMEQAGLVIASKFQAIGSQPESTLISITWAGHDFVDATRDDALWKRAIKVLNKEGVSFTFEIVKDWLRENTPPIPAIPPIF